MSEQYAIVPFVAQVKKSPVKTEGDLRDLSHDYGRKFADFLSPLLQELDETVDKRPLRTLVQGTEAILAFRDRAHGLLLSELGDAMDGLLRGGGTKRLSTLIHHQGWKAQQIEAFLLRRADALVSRL